MPYNWWFNCGYFLIAIFVGSFISFVIVSFIHNSKATGSEEYRGPKEAKQNKKEK